MMMSAIEGGRVCVACKAMLYRTAVVGGSLADGLSNDPRCKDIGAGAVVAVQFAGRTLDGEPVFYFGLVRGRWVGLAPEHGFRDFVL
jgi:hypothetical protein